MAEEHMFRYLSRADVRRCLPPIGGQIDLAEEALVALARDQAEAPARSAVHPRDESSLIAMPAWVRISDTVGVKWVSSFPANPSADLPGVTALIVVNDADTGLPLCVMDGTEITARRTAAVSGAAVRLFLPPPGGGGGSRRAPPPYRLGFIGAGNQARMHLDMLLEIVGSLELRVFDAVLARAELFVEEATGRPGVVGATVVGEVAAACDGADLLVSAVSSPALGADGVSEDLLTPHCLVLTIDRGIMVTAPVASGAGLFLVDDLAQFLNVRDVESGGYSGYPRPHASLGRALVADERIASGRGGGAGPDDPDAVVASSGRAVAAALGGSSDGRVVLTCVGVGAVDVVTAGAVYRVAELEGIGDVLER